MKLLGRCPEVYITMLIIGPCKFHFIRVSSLYMPDVWAETPHVRMRICIISDA